MNKIITQDCQNDKNISTSIYNFFKKYKVYSCLKSANAYKNKGFSVIDIFQYLVCLIFENRSMYMNMLTNKENTKDVLSLQRKNAATNRNLQTE